MPAHKGLNYPELRNSYRYRIGRKMSISVIRSITMTVTTQETFEYHRRGRPGKIEVSPTKPLLTQRDLSLAYTPGVAKVVEEVERRPESAYEYTAKANLV